MADPKQPPAVSPFSTGAGGPNFELKVAVTFVAKLLTDKIARGCHDGSGPVRAVKLQQRNRKKEVDDVIAVYQRGEDEGELTLQVKHSLRFTTGNDEFADSLQQCWRQFRREDFDESLHRVGIAFGEGSNIQKVRQNIPELLEWARSSESAEAFLEKSNAIVAKNSYVTVFREVLERVAAHAIPDVEFWCFLKVFVIIPFDFADAGSRDAAQVIEDLRDIAPNSDAGRASELAAILFRIASDFAKSGGELTIDTLLPQLPSDVRSRIPTAAIDNARSTKTRLADQVRRELRKQINSRKYIPQLFVESNETKDIARLFCNPVFFFRKVVADLERVNLTRLNTMCGDFGISKVAFELPVDFEFPQDFRDLQNRCERLEQQCAPLLSRVKELEHTPDGADLDEHHRYLLTEKWHMIGAWTISHRLETIHHNIAYLKGGALLLLSPAGQGKTNFVCDLAALTLLYGTPAVFFTGKSLVNAPLNNLDEFIWSIAGPNAGSKDETIEHVRRICIEKNMPFVVLIDAINEHPRLPDFAAAMESCIERLLKHEFVRVVLTCRSEFFDARFKNLETSSFCEHVHKIDRLHQRMEPFQAKRMVRRYLSFYNLRPAISYQARKKLEGDPFLLRIFCEAYGDPSGRDVTHVPFLADIYRDRLFTDYLSKKLEQLVHRRGDRGAPILGGERYYVEPLMTVVGKMVETEDFSSVAVRLIPSEQLEPIEELLYEDIIIRKDLSFSSRPSLGDEVVAFPFDELRDFLIAKFLVDVVLQRDDQQFLEKTRTLLQAKYTVVEGVSRFLFYVAKRGGHSNLHELVKEEQWYKESFLDAIFAIEDELINDSDIVEIRRRFSEDARNAAKITCALIHRFDKSIYRQVNIGLLFEMLDQLSKRQFQTHVVPTFTSSRHRGTSWLTGRAVWPIERLAENLVVVVGNSDDDDLHRLSPLFELLLYLLSVHGADYDYPARNAVVTLLESKPELGNRVLLPKLKILSEVYSPYHWDLLGDLLRGGQSVPAGTCDAAKEVWSTVHDSNGEYEQTRISLEQFFQVAHQRKVCEIPKNILDQIEEMYRDRIRLWSKLF